MVLLPGCAALPEGRLGAAGVEFEMDARAAVRYRNNGGSTRIAWRHGSTIDDVLITGALGQGLARITRRGEQVQLVAADGKEYHSKDAESLTESVLGWRLPLAGLADWIRGRPSRDRPARVEDAEDGRIRVLWQDDWRIEYLSWNGAVPGRVTLQHEGPDGVVELRVIIDKWTSLP